MKRSYLSATASALVALLATCVAVGPVAAQPAAAQAAAQPPDRAAAQPTAQNVARRRPIDLPDTPGSGPFAAIKEEVPSLADHVVYRPADLTRLGATKLGLYLFGNGGCSNDGASSRLHLLEIASHGYLAIALGRIRSGPGATVPPDPPRPARPAGGTAQSAAGAPQPAASAAPRALPPPATDSKGLTAALEWALAQNADPASPYHGRIDSTAVAVSGYSCGGLQALQVAADPRVKTVVIMNSGLFNEASPIPNMNASKTLLQTVHTSIFYVLGGETDIAYKNGMDDFARLNHVPAVVANVLGVGHGGTYWEPNGGKAAAAVVAWLNWQLRGDPRAAETFVGSACGLCVDPAWKVERKLLAASDPVGALAPPQASCANLAKLTIPGSRLDITRAEWIPAGSMEGRGGAPPTALPAHCRVEGVLDPRTGVGGRTYGIGFAMSLPEHWTGQFLQMGGGGLNGSLAAPVGGQNAGNTPALARGYAVVSTDGGHKGTGAFDGSFMQDQQALLDFEYIAIGRTATLAKQIIEAYYRKPPRHSYYVGCSTGGREAMLMAQRYPLYFDGLVAGAPAQRTGLSNLADRTVAVALNRIAPKDADGRPVPGGALSSTDRKAVVDKLLEVCDGLDGAKDGMIFDTRGCTFDPAMLACKGPKAEGCLSAEQVGAIQKGFAGPKDSRGSQVYPGFFFDTGIIATEGIPGLLAGGNSPVGPRTPPVEQDVDKEAAAARANPGAQVGDSSSWTNLNTFFGHGGKLIFFHGVSDPWFSAKDTIDYYERMTAANGGVDTVMASSRLFLSPGMGHCGGGPAALDRFDMLTAISNWVEKGVAPASVNATGRAFPGRSRPLCAYPAHARYKGQGDPEDAANYECRQ